MAERTEALFRLNGGRAEGWGGREGDAPAVGRQDNRTASHMWAGGGRAQGLWGLHTVALLQGGEQLIRFEEMDHSLKSPTPGRLDKEHPCQCIWLNKMEESKKAKRSCKSKGSQVVFTPQELINIEFYERESGSNATWVPVMTSKCDGMCMQGCRKHSKSLKCTFSNDLSSVSWLYQADRVKNGAPRDKEPLYSATSEQV